MRFTLKVLCLLVLMCGGSDLLADQIHDPAVDQLQWLDFSSPDQCFIRDAEAGRLRFYAVYGYARRIPGIGGINFSRCYGGVELTTIEGTGDIISSREHGRLIDLANDFALNYNTLMKNHIDSVGKGDCAPRTDWDAMFTKVTEKVWGSSQLEGITSVNPAGKPVLTIDLKDLSRAGNILEYTCKTLKDHGIEEPVSVEFYEWLPGPGYNHEKFKSFTCSEGRIL